MFSRLAVTPETVSFSTASQSKSAGGSAKVTVVRFPTLVDTGTLRSFGAWGVLAASAAVFCSSAIRAVLDLYPGPGCHWPGGVLWPTMALRELPEKGPSRGTGPKKDRKCTKAPEN